MPISALLLKTPRMMKAFIVIHAVSLWLLTSAALFTVCAAELKITVGGAQSLAPLAEKFSSQFNKRHPGIAIEIRRANSSYAISAVRSGEIQIGLVARSLSAGERSEFRVESLGHDALVILSYPWNPVGDLTLEQLQKIYLGRITNWREVGGQDQGIVPLTRELTSGLHAVFVERLFGKEFHGQEKAFILRANKDKVLRTIKRIRGSVGYGIVGMEEAQSEGIKVLAIEGKLPTAENIREETYPFVRPQLLISRGSPGGVVGEWMLGFTTFARKAAGREVP
jgi:phosphate transport system substrate-binding protein